MYLLDTNVLSELRVEGRAQANTNVSRWAVSSPVEVHFISVITLMELEIGVLSMERRDPLQARLLRLWLERKVIPVFQQRTLPVTIRIAQRCAELHVPNKRPANDALIAATALIHGFTVVTRNIADFTATGVPTLNPWEPQP